LFPIEEAGLVLYLYGLETSLIHCFVMFQIVWSINLVVRLFPVEEVLLPLRQSLGRIAV